MLLHPKTKHEPHSKSKQHGFEKKFIIQQVLCKRLCHVSKLRHLHFENTCPTCPRFHSSVTIFKGGRNHDFQDRKQFESVLRGASPKRISVYDSVDAKTRVQYSWCPRVVLSHPNQNEFKLDVFSSAKHHGIKTYRKYTLSQKLCGVGFNTLNPKLKMTSQFFSNFATLKVKKKSI